MTDPAATPAGPQVDIIAAQVRNSSPVDQREAAAKAEVLAGLQALAAPFDQTADRIHVTGSALVVGARGIVLHRHKRLGLWLQPGGHLEKGEWPAQAALRESMEETGLALRHHQDPPVLLHVDAHDGGRGHRHLDLRYIVTGDDSDPAPAAGESQACHWFDWDTAARLADEGLVGALHAARSILL
ncbi:MAG: NUDIX hydrolase [Euzebya sp.]